MIQVAGGDKIPGTTYMCLLPLKETNNRYNSIETLARVVPTIITEIPLMDIKMLSIDMFKEYTNECETTGEEHIYKLEHLPSCYGGRILMLLSSQTFRPKVFFTSKEGTTLASHHFRTGQTKVIIGGVLPNRYLTPPGQDGRNAMISETTKNPEIENTANNSKKNRNSNIKQKPTDI